MRRSTLALLSLVSLTLLPGWECGEPILDDPGFDLWCGDKLCSWEVGPGTVRRVPTWHRSDYGVELVGDPVVLRQDSAVTSAESTCFLVELQADRDDDVRLTLEMDFLRDGHAEYSHDLASDDWQEVQYRVATPTWYEGVRFTIRKTGAGAAVISTIRVIKSGDCAGPPLALVDPPLGARCESAADCESGRCEKVYQLPMTMSQEQTCSGCAADADCPAGEACGVEAGSGLKLYLACGAPDRHALGERCQGDAECATGICCEGLCSACCAGRACTSGQTCKERPWSSLGKEYQATLFPWQCAPGAKLGEAGEPCLFDDDCDSGSCKGSGPLRVCSFDGRTCTQDSDCPIFLWSQGSCLPLGQRGGRCD